MNTVAPPEYESVLSFVEFLYEDDREEFSHTELQKLNEYTHKPIRELRHELESYGLRLAARPSEPKVRGFRSNNHDRWQSYMSHGGSGWSQISGFAGQEG